MSDTIEVFISYSKQDKELRDGLLAHLRPLERQGIITWHDRQVLPGTEWDDEIKTRLNAADIILLLISADFLNTDYCNQVEIPEALRQHKAREATVMPVILRQCGWQYTPLSAIQAYPEKAKPIKSWADIDEAYTSVVDGVYLAATEIKTRRNQQQTAEQEKSRKAEQLRQQHEALKKPVLKGTMAPTKVFISYSWDSNEHKDKVLSLANRLRNPWGIETDIDQYIRARPPYTPEKGWDIWMHERIQWAEFVLVICTETYKHRFQGSEELGIGLGVTYEGTIIRRHLYKAQLRNTKYIPVVFSAQDLIQVPDAFGSSDKYVVENEQSFRDLCYRLRKEPTLVIPEVITGQLPLGTYSNRTSVAFKVKEASASAAEPPPVHLEVAETLPRVPLKNLQNCDPNKILFIKNVKHPDPNAWAYSLEQMRQPESRTFELMWRASSHGVNQPKAEDLMILHQRAKVTHIVEFLDAQVRQTDIGWFRWVRAVWIAEKDWSLLPHQKHILGFSPNYADGNTHSLKSLGFSTFRKTWSNLEEFQRHIVKQLTQSESIVPDEDELTSEKGVDYTRLRDLLKAGHWEEADRETVICMCAVMGRQEKGWLRVEDIEQFPCADLRAIDKLWVDYSDGKFGFSVQKQIWQECGTPTKTQKDRFAEEVGWKEEGISINSNWKSYPEYTFDLSARRGHLPSRLYGGWDGRRMRFEDTLIADKWTAQAGYGRLVYDSVSSLARRLVRCSI